MDVRQVIVVRKDLNPAWNNAVRGVYRIVNTLNSKCYVGSSNNIWNRWRRHHMHALRNGKHWNSHLQAAWDKYGEGSFSFEVLETVPSDDDLIAREQHWIDAYNSADRTHGYNQSPFANRSKRTAESIAKQIKTRGDRYKGENAPMYGKTHTEESKQKIREAGKRRIGMTFSDEHKKHIGDAQRGRSWEERFGKERADEIRRERAEAAAARRLAKESEVA